MMRVCKRHKDCGIFCHSDKPSSLGSIGLKSNPFPLKMQMCLNISKKAQSSKSIDTSIFTGRTKNFH